MSVIRDFAPVASAPFFLDFFWVLQKTTRQAGRQGMPSNIFRGNFGSRNRSWRGGGAGRKGWGLMRMLRGRLDAALLVGCSVLIFGGALTLGPPPRGGPVRMCRAPHRRG